MGLTKREDSGIFAIILSDATIRVKTTENDPEAVRREFENSTTKEVGVKFERVYNKISGIIKGIEFHDGEYGKNLNITLKDGEEEFILSVSMNSNFAEDIMKKLPGVNLLEVVEFAPYSFEDDKGKKRRGVTITQNEVKLKNFFVGEDNKTLTNGYPEVEGDTSKFDNKDWQVYFIKASKFLQKYIEENVMTKLEMFSGEVVEEGTEVNGQKIDF